jgi:transposase
MSLHKHPIDPIPEEIQRAVTLSVPKGTLAIHLRDALGTIYEDDDFADLFPKRGRGAHAPWRLALITVLQAGENLSDAQAVMMMQTRLDWKYALSLPLDDEGFDVSLLSDFRQRLVDGHAQERLLEPLLRLCRERGWLGKGGKQRIDSTMVLGQVRGLNSLETVGETLRVALNTWAEDEPEWLVGVVSVDWFDRYVHRFELQRFPKGKEKRDALLKQVGEDAHHLLMAASSEQAPEAIKTSEWREVLQQVWDQHYEKGEHGVHWRDGPLVNNARRVVSPHEQEARESRKRTTEWIGYKVHIAESCEQEEMVHLITHVQTVEATRQDVQETEQLLDALEKKGFSPEQTLVDNGYLSGEIIVQQGNKGNELIGPVGLETHWQKKTGYDLEAFRVDWQAKEAHCPQGQTSVRWKPGHGNRGEEIIQVSFAGQTCQCCPVKDACTKSVSAGRTLTIAPQAIHEELQRRRKQQTSPAFQQIYAQRAGIEGTISQGVRKYGMRRARYRGKEKIQIQMNAVATAINISRLEEMQKRKEAGLPPRRQRAPSPFPRLKARMPA